VSVLTVGAAGAGGVYDYTCDGTADQVEILAALAASSPGDTVQLSAGTFTCAASIAVPIGVTLAGAAGTVLQFPVNAAYVISPAAGSSLADMGLAGSITVYIEASDIDISGVTSRQTIYGPAAFRIRPSTGLVENVTFTDCHAIDTSATGWFIGGPGGGGMPADTLVENVTFTGCTAINCGASYDAISPISSKDWITGFCLQESTARTFVVENLALVDCHAEGCWESGYYCEGTSTSVTCTMLRCTSTRNGRTKVGATGCGFATMPDWALPDCVATENIVGIWCKGTYAPALNVEPHLLTRCEAIDNVADGIVAYGAAADYPLSNVTLNQCTVAGALAPSRYLYLRNVTGAQIADLRVRDSTGALEEAGSTSGTVITYYLEPFTVATDGPVTGETVAFTDRSYGPSTWSWDFGDGDGSTAQHPAHVYPAAGPYIVTLTAGGNTVAQTITVRPGITFGGARLSEADLGPLDHDPIANATDLHNGRVGLQGSPVSRRTWTINALADDRAEIEALEALTGQHLILNINGVEYPGTMIRPPLLETQLTPAAWAYQVGFVQETRR